MDLYGAKAQELPAHRKVNRINRAGDKINPSLSDKIKRERQ